MGQCVCKRNRAAGDRPYGPRAGGGRGTSGGPGGDRRSRETSEVIAPSSSRSSRTGGSSHEHSHLLIQTLGLDIKDLIMETLAVIRTLVNNEQEPPPAMFKLNLIADRESGWLLIVQTMIDIIPVENPLGPAVITLFLDESPLPTKETVCKLLYFLNLNPELSHSKERSPQWHRNVCIVLGCIAEKLSGPNCVAIFKLSTMEYLVANLSPYHHASVILFSLIALEKYAQTSENKMLISARLLEAQGVLTSLEKWLVSDDFVKRQVGFCAQWSLDNMFLQPGRSFSFETINTSDIQVMLNHNDVSEYLKISPDGLEARCDVSSFESVRCTFQVNTGVWFYEALILTPGVMQIGWATKDSKFLNHDGYGIGDDDFSVAYDGCRQLLWHNASSQPHSQEAWKPGDTLGCLLDLDNYRVMFYLNGVPLKRSHSALFEKARSGFFPAASFMSFQQCQFNFGHRPFAFPPPCQFSIFNDHAQLTDEQRIILPRHKKLEKLRQTSVAEDSCCICFNFRADVLLFPCGHGDFCSLCSMVLEKCPLCRGPIDERRTIAGRGGPFPTPGGAPVATSSAPAPSYGAEAPPVADGSSSQTSTPDVVPPPDPRASSTSGRATSLRSRRGLSPPAPTANVSATPPREESGPPPASVA